MTTGYHDLPKEITNELGTPLREHSMPKDFFQPGTLYMSQMFGNICECAAKGKSFRLIMDYNKAEPRTTYRIFEIKEPDDTGMSEESP